MPYSVGIYPMNIFYLELFYTLLKVIETSEITRYLQTMTTPAWSAHVQHAVLAPTHDDVIKWKHFPPGIHRSPVNYPHKSQRRGALICARTNIWDAGDLRRQCTHYDVTALWLITVCTLDLQVIVYRFGFPRNIIITATSSPYSRGLYIIEQYGAGKESKTFKLYLVSNYTTVKIMIETATQMIFSSTKRDCITRICVRI